MGDNSIADKTGARGAHRYQFVFESTGKSAAVFFGSDEPYFMKFPPSSNTHHRLDSRRLHQRYAEKAWLLLLQMNRSIPLQCAVQTLQSPGRLCRIGLILRYRLFSRRCSNPHVARSSRSPARAPLPGAQRPPLLGRTLLAAVCQTNDAGIELVIIRLNTYGIQDRKSPSVGDRVVVPAWTSLPHCRLRCQLRGRSGDLNSTITGTGLVVFTGTVTLAWMSTVICGSAELSTCPASVRVSVHSGIDAVRRAGNRPGNTRHIRRNTAVHFALKTLGNLRPPGGPLDGGGHRRSIVHLQHRRQGVFVRIGVCFIGSGRIIRVWPRSNRFHTNLIHHVLMVVKHRRLRGCKPAIHQRTSK